MSGRDILALALDNLWRKKLRAVLTIAGVTIAIATFVAMLSFTAGNQRYMDDIYSRLGLMANVHVYPEDEDGAEEGPVLDAEALERFEDLDGVRMVHPFFNFDVTVAVADTSVTTSARAMPRRVLRTQLFEQIFPDADFTSDHAAEALVTHEFLEAAGLSKGDSLVGRELILSLKVASLDSAAAGAMADPGTILGDLATLHLDSLRVPGYLRRSAMQILTLGAGGFLDGFLNRQATVRDTLTIRSVGVNDPSVRMNLGATVLLPEGRARRLSEAGIILGGDPAALLAAARGGRLFAPGDDGDGRVYPMVVIQLEPTAHFTAVTDTLEALGYRTFSFAEQFQEMQRFYLYFYLGMGAVGLIALATAALGILNTMVMSITERFREIGILKSLGADEGDIRRIFLCESAAIGAIGAALGIGFGWLGARVASMIMRAVMSREELVVFDPFATPLWLVGLAFAFGLLVSLLAGTWPAARAARVDAVEALRSE